MQKLCTLAAASLLFLGLSSSAGAAPVTVTYGFGPGNALTWGCGVCAGGATVTNPGATLVVTYATGTTAIGGFKAGPSQIAVLQAAWTSAFTIIGNAVPGMVVGGGLAAAGTAGPFAGATVIPANFAGPGLPPITLTGNAALSLIPLGAATIGLIGSGTQIFIGPTFPVAWALGAGTATAVPFWVGQEISRTLVPEPSTALLLIGALGGLGLVGAGTRKIRR